MAFHSGIGRYVRNLTRELVRAAPGMDLTLWVQQGGSLAPWSGLPVRTAVFDAPIYGLREQWFGSRLCRTWSGGRGVCHVPHYNAPWALPRRSVVTIHDLTHLELEEHFPALRVTLARRVMGRAVHRAGRIIAVSTATRDALLERFPDAGSKTTVIHLGVEGCFRPPPSAELEAFRVAEKVGRCFVCVASPRPHKNVAMLLRAFARLREVGAGPQLVLVGEPPPGAGPLQGVRVERDIPDDRLALWYAAAEAVLLPSLNEGFGLPAVEAMACGTPVIASAIPALREVVADAGLLVDPRDADAWTAAMQRVLDGAGLRDELARAGAARARGFSWAETARRTLEVYAAAAEGPGG